MKSIFVLAALFVAGQAALAAPMPIPELALWEKNMVEFGAKYQDQRAMTTWEGAVWYYDGQRVFFQLADYTHDEKWKQAAQNSAETYRGYVLNNDGKIPGWRIFPHGLFEDFKRNGDVKSKEAVIALSKRSAYAFKGGGESAELSRETAYILQTYLFAEELGAPKHPMRDEAVKFAFAHMDQWFGKKSAPLLKPFMVGLTCEALIRWHEKTRDPRVLPAIKGAADWMWAHAWVAADQAFWYERKVPYETAPADEKGAPDLNLLVAPIYAWLYLRTRDVKYRDEGDQVFAGGVRKAYLGGGKQFSQSYRWSFAYVQWRQEAEKPREAGSTLRQ